MILLLLACAHPVALAPVPSDVGVERERAQTMRGEECLWEAEDLTTGGAAVWATPRPEIDEEWCREGHEEARTVDIVDKSGPFLSTVLGVMEGDRWTQRCVTWDLRRRAPATLEDLNAREAPAWWSEVGAKIAADPSLAGWTVSRDAWVLAPGGVAFCATRDGQVRQIPVRASTAR